jgi:hypothetical protein
MKPVIDDRTAVYREFMKRPDLLVNMDTCIFQNNRLWIDTGSLVSRANTHIIGVSQCLEDI